jgi:hypothetical protein
MIRDEHLFQTTLGNFPSGVDQPMQDVYASRKGNVRSSRTHSHQNSRRLGQGADAEGIGARSIPP